MNGPHVARKKLSSIYLRCYPGPVDGEKSTVKQAGGEIGRFPCNIFLFF
jgi:hypothetical protein